MNAREAALLALGKVRRSGVMSEAALNDTLSKENLDTRDAALASRIFYGVLQNRALCDFYIGFYSTVKTMKMEPLVLDILRLSVYQIILLSKIPVTAAVNEAVKLTKKYANPRAAGLVNAILRKLSAQRGNLPAVTGSSTADKLSVQFSHPRWLVDEMLNRLGENDTEGLLQANNADAPITVRVNTLKADAGEVLASLAENQIEASRHPWLEDCLELRSLRHIEQLDAFKDGSFYVQDPAAVLAVKAAAPKSGMFVIDACAAPGGKSFGSAIEMKDIGSVLSCDISENKLRRIEDGKKRLGLTSITTRLADARQKDETLIDRADIVIADVPCSGFGVIRKKPEIRYKDQQEIRRLPEIQRQIVRTMAQYVKPGGVLIYSTCTLLKEENEDVVTAFLEEHPEFQPEAFTLPEPVGDASTGMTTLWPHIHGTDGFFICRLRRLT